MRHAFILNLSDLIDVGIFLNKLGQTLQCLTFEKEMEEVLPRLNIF